MSQEPLNVEFHPIHLETIRNLFCLDLPDTYQTGFSFEAPFTPHQMMTAILRNNGLETMADVFDAAGANPAKMDYSIGCISTPNGSCFAYARFRSESGVPHLVFMSTTIQQELDGQGRIVSNIVAQSILTGIENEDSGQQYFAPFACLCLLITDEDEIEENLADQLIEPASEAELYGALCYIQQSMATCICGNELDTIRNQCWLIPPMTERAYDEFSNIVGASCVEDVIKTHLQYLTLAEELLAEAEGEEPDTVASQHKFPERTLN